MFAYGNIQLRVPILWSGLHCIDKDTNMCRDVLAGKHSFQIAYYHWWWQVMTIIHCRCLHGCLKTCMNNTNRLPVKRWQEE